jgi:hypothetical protein
MMVTIRAATDEKQPDGKWVVEVFKPLPEEEARLWREYMDDDESEDSE